MPVQWFCLLQSFPGGQPPDFVANSQPRKKTAIDHQFRRKCITFSLHDFILAGLKDAVSKMADYQAILNTAAWQEKSVLTNDDLAGLSGMIETENTLK